MHLRYLVIDAFADGPFTGNPAAVVWLERPSMIDDATRQRIAGEFNLSETAYLCPDGESEALGLRWFTPVREVPLCGHATLAAAEASRRWARASGPQIRFATLSGELTCWFTDGQVRMDFPAMTPEPIRCPDDAAAVLGVPGPVRCVGTTPMNLTLQLPTAEQVRAARPDLGRLASWHEVGVTITASGDDGRCDFISRFFAPRAGVDEDPVTGSAHCSLGPFWAEQLGRTELIGHQCSARGGIVGVAVRGDRVELRGGAVVVMDGVIRLP